VVSGYGALLEVLDPPKVRPTSTPDTWTCIARRTAPGVVRVVVFPVEPKRPMDRANIVAIDIAAGTPDLAHAWAVLRASWSVFFATPCPDALEDRAVFSAARRAA